MKRAQALLLELMISVGTLLAQTAPSIEWQRTLGGTLQDNAGGIVQVENGDFLIGGGTQSTDGDVSGNHGQHDLWVVRLNGLGQDVWQHCYGGTGSDQCYAMARTSNSGCVLVGLTTSNNGDVSGAHGSNDVWTCEIDGAGELIWQRPIGGTLYEAGYGVGTCQDGGFLFTGYSASANGDFDTNHGDIDVWAAKISSDGTLIWSEVYGGSDEDWGYAIAQTADGGSILLGEADSNDGDLSTLYNGPDVWVIKLDATGGILWQRELGGYGVDIGRSIIETPDGGFVFLGTTGSDGDDVTQRPELGSEDNFWIGKLDSNGFLVWDQSYGGTGTEYGGAIRTTSDGGFVIVGSTTSADVDVAGAHGLSDIWVFKVSGSGELLWQKTLGGSDYDGGVSIQQTDDGGYIVTGTTLSNDFDVSGNHGDADIWVVKLSPEDQASCDVVLAPPDNLVVPALGESGYQVSVGIATGCAWTAVSNDSAMIQITSGAFGSGNGTVVYSVAPNPGPSIRNGTMTIAGQAFLVTQAGSSPIIYTISSSTQPETGLFPNPTPLSTTPHVKLCADGSRATLFTATLTSGSTNLSHLRFRMAEANGDVGYSGAFDNQYDTTANSITTRFTHPRYMNEPGYSRFDHVELYDVDDQSTVLASVPVYIYRAPVAFIHGLYGSEATFAYQTDMFLATGLYPYEPTMTWESPLIWRADYQWPSLQGFGRNRRVVPNAIDSLLTQAIASGYSCGKAIVIGHSMGGVLSRVYLQAIYGNPAYRNDIQKLITLNTPHYGTQLANRCTQAPTLFGLSLNLPPPCSSLGLVGLALGAQSLRDLRIDSAPILALNSQSQTNLVPCATLASIRSGVPNPITEPGAFAFYTAFSPAIVGANIYQGEQHDLVVPLSSQQSNLQLGSVVQPQWHIGSAEHISYFDQLDVLVNSDPLGANFSQTGFPQDQLEFLMPISEDVVSALRERSIDEVSIVSPAAGQEFLPGQTVTVEISSSGEIERMALIVFGNSIDPIVIDTTNVLSLQFQVPDEALGDLTVNLLGGTEADWTAGDESYITILPLSVPDSIRANPGAVQLPLGLAQAVSVTGYFQGTAASLLDIPGLDFEFDPGYLSYEGSGVFRGLALGSTEAICVFQEMRDTIEFTIVDDPAALIAAFTNSEEHICAGDTVHFQDISQGLVSGYQWAFPGGTPSFSSSANPVVAYSMPGAYPVTLVTTFQNGVDSITVDELIVVTSPPTAEIFDGGSVLSATTVGASYQWLDCNNGNAPIPDEVAQEFTPLMTGQYAVAVTEGNCTSISDCFFFITTGMSASTNDDGIAVVPNPNDGESTLLLAACWKGATVAVEDMAGRVVLREQVQGRQRIPLDLDAPAGVYTVKVSDASRMRSLRMVVW